MGDSNKPPPNDAPWTDAEQSFFAGAPPEEPEAPGDVPRLDNLFPVLQQRPRRAIFARLRSPLAAAWRTTTLVLGAASARARRQVSAAAAGFVAALSSLPASMTPRRRCRAGRGRGGRALRQGRHLPKQPADEGRPGPGGSSRARSGGGRGGANRDGRSALARGRAISACWCLASSAACSPKTGARASVKLSVSAHVGDVRSAR